MKWIQKRKTQLTNVAFLIGALMMAPATSAETTASDPKSGQWRVAGQDLSNSRNQPAEHLIGAGNVKALSPQWTFTTGGDVSATPTVDGNAVYFPDWAGNLFAVEKKSGRLIWSHKIAEYNGVAGSRSEEHTSELQSPCNLVCRLLLEKKKKSKSYIIIYALTNDKY